MTVDDSTKFLISDITFARNNMKEANLLGEYMQKKNEIILE